MISPVDYEVIPLSRYQVVDLLVILEMDNLHVVLFLEAVKLKSKFIEFVNER